jgi:hypothetical protein
MPAKPAACALLVLVALAGCSDRDGGPAVQEADPAADEVAPGDLPPALQYEPGFVDAGGSFVPQAAAVEACTSIGDSTVTVDPTAAFLGDPHDHDLWEGASEKVIFEGDIAPGPGSWFATPGALVLAGAGRADFKLEWDQVPGGADWRRLGIDLPFGNHLVDHVLDFTTSGQVHTIEFTHEMTDPPHAGATRWGLRLPPATPADDSIPDEHKQRAESVLAYTQGDARPATTLTWTIHRTHDCLPLDPPHYDLWGNATETVVLAETHACSWTQAAEGGTVQCSPSEGAYAGLVPPLATTVVVDLQWDATEPPVQFGIEYAGADQKTGTTSVAWSRPQPTVDEPGHREYRIDVAEQEADSFYANATAWRFQPFLDGLGHDAVDHTGKYEGTLQWRVVALR